MRLKLTLSLALALVVACIATILIATPQRAEARPLPTATPTRSRNNDNKSHHHHYTPTPTPWASGDERLNAHAAAPIAVYMDPLTIYSIDPGSSATTLLLTITDEAIEAAGIPADEPLLLAEDINPATGMAITLFRLPDGSFQLNTYYADGKPYQVAWSMGDSTVTPLLW